MEVVPGYGWKAPGEGWFEQLALASLQLEDVVPA
jgi:hypothetical protein